MTQQLLANVSVSVQDAGQASAGTEVVGTSVDMSGYDGVAFFTTIATANAGNFLKAQDSADNSAFNDVAGSKVVAAANANLVALDIYRPQLRYARPHIIRAGANTATGFILAIRYNGRKRPYVNTVANVTKVVSLISPADGTP